MALRKAAVVDAPKSEATETTTQVDKEVKTEVVKEVEAKASDVVKDDAPLQGESTAQGEQAEAAAEVTSAVTTEEVKEDTLALKDEIKPEQRSVAVASAGTTVAAPASEQRKGVMQEFKEELAAEGFEDLEVTGMSFERVRLHEGTFKIGQDDAELGKEFKCQILSTRAIYVVRQDSSQDAEMFYSYDPAGQLKTDGSSAEETLAEWRSDGYGVEGSPLEIKPYREVMATLKGRDDEYDEMVVSLSIPPASVDRIAGVAFTAKQKFKRLPSGVITECKVGKLIGEGTKAFRPWVFKVTQTIEQYEAAVEAAEAAEA